MQLMKVRIDEIEFVRASSRDTEWEPLPQDVFLDCETGNLIWIYKDDHDAHDLCGMPDGENKATRDLVATDPNRYIPISGLSHREHHEILRDFLDSNWTADRELRQAVSDAYDGSIGRWRKKVSRGADNAYFDYRERIAKESAERSLRRAGIEADFTSAHLEIPAPTNP